MMLMKDGGGCRTTTTNLVEFLTNQDLATCADIDKVIVRVRVRAYMCACVCA